jgi:4-methylaminobutanoate oxidase (formaldehyde-forming)
VWGADVTPDDTPYEAGLGFCVKLDKAFVGRDALEEGEPRRRLCCLVLDDPRAVALGNEPVRLDGRVAGRVTSGGYGYTVGRSIAYAHLPAEYAEAGTRVAVDVFGEWIEGEVADEPLFDPKGAHVRG